MSRIMFPASLLSILFFVVALGSSFAVIFIFDVFWMQLLTTFIVMVSFYFAFFFFGECFS